MRGVLDRIFSRPTSTPAPMWVEQLEGKGCCVASVAMIMGRSYWEARTLFPHFSSDEGLTSGDALRALGEYGWAWSSRYEHYSPEKRNRRVWPCAPFAPVHLCAVISTGWHAVVMLADGRVIDPLFPPDYPLTLSDYRVLEIHGLWKVR